MEKLDVDADGDCPKLFNKTVRKYLSQVKRCHTEAIKQNPGLGGRVVVEVEIEDGKVIFAQKYSNTTNNTSVAKCIVRKVKRWKFPGECTGMATFPFVLTPPN